MTNHDLRDFSEMATGEFNETFDKNSALPKKSTSQKFDPFAFFVFSVSAEIFERCSKNLESKCAKNAKGNRQNFFANFAKVRKTILFKYFPIPVSSVETVVFQKPLTAQHHYSRRFRHRRNNQNSENLQSKAIILTLVCDFYRGKRVFQKSAGRWVDGPSLHF